VHKQLASEMCFVNYPKRRPRHPNRYRKEVGAPRHLPGGRCTYL